MPALSANADPFDSDGRLLIQAGNEHCAVRDWCSRCTVRSCMSLQIICRRWQRQPFEALPCKLVASACCLCSSEGAIVVITDTTQRPTLGGVSTQAPL